MKIIFIFLLILNILIKLTCNSVVVFNYDTHKFEISNDTDYENIPY